MYNNSLETFFGGKNSVGIGDHCFASWGMIHTLGNSLVLQQ